MGKRSIRIENITIENFKNVKKALLILKTKEKIIG